MLLSPTMRRRNRGCFLLATFFCLLFLFITVSSETTRHLTKRKSNEEEPYEWTKKLDEYLQKEYFGRTADEYPQKKAKTDEENKSDIPSTIPFGYSDGDIDDGDDDEYWSSSSAKGSKATKGSKSGGSKGSKGKGKGNIYDRHPTSRPTYPYTTSPNFLNPDTMGPSPVYTASPSLLKPDTAAPSPIYTASPSLLNPMTTAPSTASPSLLKPPSLRPGATPSPTNSSLTFSPSFTNTSVPSPVNPNVTQAPASSIAPTKVPSNGTAVPGVPGTLIPVPPPTNVPGNVPTTTAPVGTVPPTTIVPAPTGTTLAPAPSNAVPIRKYYIAYEVAGVTQEPSDAELMTITQVTNSYFEDVFTAQYSGNPTTVFDLVETVLDETKLNASIPEAKYNIYMAFSSSVVFKAGSIFPPEPDLFEIMQSSIGTTYIVNYLWQAPNTVFIGTQTVIMDEVPSSGNNSTTISSKASDYNFGQLESKFVLPKSKITNDIFREESQRK